MREFQSMFFRAHRSDRKKESEEARDDDYSAFSTRFRITIAEAKVAYRMYVYLLPLSQFVMQMQVQVLHRASSRQAMRLTFTNEAKRARARADRRTRERT